MRRYYVCPVIGTGTEEDPYRPKVADYNVAYVAVIGGNPDGSPKKSWALVLVNALDHSALVADNQIFDIPDATLDSTFGTLNNPTRRRVTDYLSNDLGMDTSWITNNTLIREIIKALGLEHDAKFNENRFDVRAFE